MMLRPLIIFFVVNEVVMGEVCGFSAYSHPLTLHSGFISTSTDYSSTDIYSVEFITVKESALNSFKEMYDLLLKHKVVPEILGASVDKSNSNQCRIYFSNILTMDSKTYPNIPYIKRSYNDLIEALTKINYSYYFSLNENSFRYNPRTDKYYFVDIVNLIDPENKVKQDLTKRKVYSIFFDWVLENKLAVQKSDDLEPIRKFLNSFHTFYHHQYQIANKIQLNDDQFIIKDEVIFKSNKFSNTKLDIDVKSMDEHYLLTANLKDHKKKTLKFNKDKEIFSIYLCLKKEEYDIECINLKKKNYESDLVWNFEVRSNQRIDVEVQHAKSEVEELTMNFYKVFLILTLIDSPGVVPESEELLLDLKSDMDINNLYIICETNHQDLRVVSSPEDEFTFKSIQMTDKSLENKTQKKVIQATPSLFPKASQSCLGNNKKIFIMEKHRSKILFVSNLEKKLPPSFSFISKQIGITRDMIYSCNEPTTYPNLYYTLNPISTISNNEQVSIYPEKQILIRDHSNEELMNELCIEAISITEYYHINYEAENTKIFSSKSNHFFLNFNSYLEDKVTNLNKNSQISPKNIVYLTSLTRLDFIDLKFRNFQYPNFKPYRIYISIVKEKYKSYVVNAIFLPSLTDIRRINEYFGTQLTLTKKPIKILDITKDEFFSFKTISKDILLENLVSHYHSSSEIVYSFDIKDFKDCYPNLSNNNYDKKFENIEINCSQIKKRTLGVSAGEKLQDTKGLPKGLQRIYSQMLKSNKIII